VRFLSGLCKSVGNCYNECMDHDAPTPKPPRRWLKSLIVLGIGLAYLAGVYWASPALRQEMKLYGVWYGVPWERPRGPHYRVRGDRRLRGFEKRLVERANRTQRVRMTMEVTQRWRSTMTRHDDTGESEVLTPVRERRFKVTLLMERTGGDNPDERVRLVIEEGKSWTAWVFDGKDGWYLFSDASLYPARAARRRLESWNVFSPLTNELEPIEAYKMVPLWPFVDARAFSAFLRGADVSPGGRAELHGVPCQVVRIERRLSLTAQEVSKLWIPEGEDRVLKAEHALPWAARLVEKLKPSELGELGTFCVVTSYEEPASFDDEEFDPAPLLKRWADAVAATVARDLKEIEEDRNPFPPGEFGGVGPEGGGSEPEQPQEEPEE